MFEITKNEQLLGEYKHILSKRTIYVKKIEGNYALIEVHDKREVVIRKEDLFNNFNQVIEVEKQSIKHQ